MTTEQTNRCSKHTPFNPKTTLSLEQQGALTRLDSWVLKTLILDNKLTKALPNMTSAQYQDFFTLTNNTLKIVRTVEKLVPKEFIEKINEIFDKCSLDAIYVFNIAELLTRGGSCIPLSQIYDLLTPVTESKHLQDLEHITNKLNPVLKPFNITLEVIQDGSHGTFVLTDNILRLSHHFDFDNINSDPSQLSGGELVEES